MRLQGPLHGYALLSAFLTTFVLASRLAAISAFPYTRGDAIIDLAKTNLLNRLLGE